MLKIFNGKKKPVLPKSLERLKRELKNKKPVFPQNLTLEEKAILGSIRERTIERNKNNITRTKAYLEFYNRHPDIHWAFLGHMVSRNGGWNMTDLKGSLLTRLLNEHEAKAIFTFLERGNWLIFQDAYSQFLLYEECLKKGENLFYLIPHLHVSTFMQAVWSHFWTFHDEYILTVSLIINEQSYLEERVIKNPFFKKKVFEKWEFKLQDYFSMNHILFPYEKNGDIKLYGLTLKHFESLHMRILLGKKLYSLLFQNKERLKLTLKWANQTVHSGSRRDYWPHLFNDIEEAIPGSPLKPRIKSCRIASGSPRLYSPTLQFAWKNIKHEEAEKGDWFEKWQVIYYLLKSEGKMVGEIEHEYCKALEKIELAAVAKKAFTIRGEKE